MTSKADTTTENLSRRVQDVEKETVRLDKLITEKYLPEEFTRRLISESIENQLQNLGKVI